MLIDNNALRTYYHFAKPNKYSKENIKKFEQEQNKVKPTCKIQKDKQDKRGKYINEAV